MTTYTTIADASIDTDSPITESLMTLLRDNPIAITEGSSGAPNIQTAAIADSAVTAAKIGAGAVHTSELSVSSATGSTSTAFNTIVLTGGLYVFSSQIKTSNATYAAYMHGGNAINNNNTKTNSISYQTMLGIGVDTAGGGTCTVNYGYVQSSPPHDMGDGDIPAFVYAVIDNATGEIESISYAVDPVWQANGPTDAVPTIRDKRGLFRKGKQITAEIKALPPAERIAAIRELPEVEIPITEELKHADMDIIPHPFQGNDLTGKTVVMLDPVSDTVRDLADLSTVGEDIHEILRGGYVKIGNTPLPRVTPAGLLIPSTEWKKTK